MSIQLTRGGLLVGLMALHPPLGAPKAVGAKKAVMPGNLPVPILGMRFAQNHQSEIGGQVGQAYAARVEAPASLLKKLKPKFCKMGLFSCLCAEQPPRDSEICEVN